MTAANDLAEAQTAEQAEKLVRETEHLVLGFKAPWCPQCEPQRGVVARVQSKFEGRVRFAYLDLAAEEGAAEEYSVTALPTLILYRYGQEVSRLAGFTPVPKLTAALDQFLSTDWTK